MEVKTNVMRILDKAKIEYTPYFYDNKDGKIDGMAIAEKINKPTDSVFKTLVTKFERDFFVFVIPVEKELNLKKCAKAVGKKTVEMIRVDEINKATGYIRGGCSPIGMKKQYVTVVDESALNCKTIIFSAGKIGAQVEMSPKDLEKIVPITFEDITQ
ncbi:MAG: Cys-tRNA(Pro) deacylase [Clostridia bacterium]|nr:Cys-tRNA(Pro) deacylase [Clostridia bacterium]